MIADSQSNFSIFNVFVIVFHIIISQFIFREIMYNYGLTGSIPDSIGNLSRLHTLYALIKPYHCNYYS